MHRKERDANIYLAILLPLGVGVAGWSALHLDPSHFDLPLAGITVLTLVFGSYLRIQLPKTKIHLTLSDTLIFVTFLVYGSHVAIVLGSIEAMTSSLNFRRKGVSMSRKTMLINVLITALSISFMAWSVDLSFGRSDELLKDAPLKLMVLILGTMAFSQFLANSILVSTIVSIRNEESLWHVWNEYCFNALVMYLSGALMAGIVTTAMSEIDPFLFGVVALFFCLVYLTYVRYVNDIKRSSAAAEQAERRRAEQAETHLGQLRHYVDELERTAEALRESRERFRHAAYHDGLTGLANRNQFLEVLEPCIDPGNAKVNGKFAVLFLDLNRFKTVNDSLGHSVGDLLIVNVAKRLRNAVGDVGTVGRLSGDEFVVLLTNIENENEAVDLAERIGHKVSAPYDIDGRQIFTSVSIGIAVGNERYRKPDEVLRDADIAMYYAKETSQSFVIFDQIMHARAVSLLELETDLRLAVERDEFELFYQPLVSLTDGSVMGFEALVRWNHPSRGLITPGEFISVAENTGIIVPMTIQLLKRACRQMVAWIEVGSAEPLTIVSVNISAMHLSQGTLVDDLRSIIAETGVSPSCLKLEITESAVMENAEAVIRLLTKIKELGVKLSIDDFGTGYSSLSYLQRFPIDTLKIDRSFVSAIDDSSENSEIVRTVVALANALQLEVIAEGIESIEQFRVLQDLGCQYGQGYLFSRPVAAGNAEVFLSGRNNWEWFEPKHGDLLVPAGNSAFDSYGIH